MSVVQEYRSMRRFVTWVMDDVFAEYDWGNFSVPTLIEHVVDYMETTITVVSLHMENTDLWGLYVTNKKDHVFAISDRSMTPNYEMLVLHELAHFLAGDMTIDINDSEVEIEQSIDATNVDRNELINMVDNVKSGEVSPEDKQKSVRLNRHILRESRAELFVSSILDRAIAGGEK